MIISVITVNSARMFVCSKMEEQNVTKAIDARLSLFQENTASAFSHLPYGVVVPLIRDENVIGIVFIGQCRIREHSNAEMISAHAIALTEHQHNFLECYHKLPEYSHTDLCISEQSLSVILKS